MAAPLINVGAFDAQLTLNTILPAANTSVTTGILDLQNYAPNSNAWRMGRIGIFFPNLPENLTGAGITVTMNCANASLTAGAAQIAPAPAIPGTFAAPAVSQVATLASVAVTGTPAQVLWMTMAFDSTGSTFQFYQFVIAVPAGVFTQGENLQISFVKDSP